MTDLTCLIAYVRPCRRQAVAKALRALPGVGWSESTGVGHGEAASGTGVEHVRFEVVTPLKRAAECSNAITEAAHTGVEGDGLIVAVPVLFVARVSDLSINKAALRADET